MPIVKKLKISICFAHLFDENILTFYPLLPRRWEKFNWLSFWNGLLLLGKEEFAAAAAVCGVYVVCVFVAVMVDIRFWKCGR